MTHFPKALFLGAPGCLELHRKKCQDVVFFDGCGQNLSLTPLLSCGGIGHECCFSRCSRMSTQRLETQREGEERLETEGFHSLSPYNHLCILIIGTTMEHLLGSCSAECFTYLNACSPHITLWAGTLVTPDLWVWEPKCRKVK